MRETYTIFTHSAKNMDRKLRHPLDTDRLEVFTEARISGRRKAAETDHREIAANPTPNLRIPIR